MATFPCTYFSVQTKYPRSGAQIRMGNSYTYTSPPVAADQRTFIVKVQGMQYFLDEFDVLDLSVESGRNMAVLEAFYNEHKMYMNFDFTHPVYGLVVCKFSTPLEIPEGISGGNGILPTFDLELIEIP